jgi:hypothetical protein
LAQQISSEQELQFQKKEKDEKARLAKQEQEYKMTVEKNL